MSVHAETPSRPTLMLREAGARMMTSDQRSRLRHAERLTRTGSKRDRRAAAAICDRIESELSEGIEESVALETARGGSVERAASGAVRMKTRDGLLSLLDAGKLTAEQFDTGLIFREGWERRSADVGSQMGGDGGGAGHDNDRFVRTRLERAKRLQRMHRMERLVAVEMRADPTGLHLLRWVAGEGNTLRSYGAGGRSFDRLVASLTTALDIAAQCRS